MPGEWEEKIFLFFLFLACSASSLNCGCAFHPSSWNICASSGRAKVAFETCWRNAKQISKLLKWIANYSTLLFSPSHFTRQNQGKLRYKSCKNECNTIPLCKKSFCSHKKPVGIYIPSFHLFSNTNTEALKLLDQMLRQYDRRSTPTNNIGKVTNTSKWKVRSPE